MRKNIYLLITFVLSLFIFCDRVVADSNIAMWLDCNYSVYKNDVNKLEKGRPIVFVGGHTGEDTGAKGDWDGYYRLLNPIIYPDKTHPAVSPWHEYDNPRFDGCWLIDANNIGSKCNKDNSYTKEEAMKRLRSGICPAVIRRDGQEKLVFAGDGTVKATYSLTDQYRFYKLNNTVNAYGYDINGYFVWTKNGKKKRTISYDSDDIGELFNRRIISSYGSAIGAYGPNFMRIAEMDYSAIIIHNKNELVFDSNNNIGNLHKELDNWYLNYGGSLSEKSKKMNEINSNNSNLINSCNVLNERYDSGKTYSFNSSYTAKSMLNDLKNLYPTLQDFYKTYSNNKVNQYKMCVSSSDATTTSALASAYNCSMANLLGDIKYVPNELQQYVMQDINEYLTDNKNLYLDETSDTNGTLNTLLKCSSYLYKYSSSFGIDSNEANNIRKKYADLAGERDIYFVYDCESLLGSELIDKINSYLNVFKIAIPILLIVFGIIDFTKAVFSDDDAMKKAQKDFIKRCFIAVLIFITPTILNLLLELANVVWEFISPGTCGLF